MNQSPISPRLSSKIANMAFLCSIMVVGIHVAGYQAPWTSMWWWSRLAHLGIFLISVPFFFTASGYFFAGHIGEKDWWPRECLKRVRSILVPYFVWCVIAVALTISVIVAANLSHGRSPVMNIPGSWRWWAQVFGFHPLCYPSIVPLWYLRSLMAYVVISPILLYALRQWGLWAVLLCYVAWGFVACIPNEQVRFFFEYSVAPVGMAFFMLGMLMRIRDWSVEVGPRWLPIVVGMTGLLVVIVSAYMLNEKDLGFRYVRMLFVPLILFAIWNFIPSAVWPRWLTSCAFAVFLMHVIVWKIFEFIATGLSYRCEFLMEPTCLLCVLCKWGLGVVVPILFAVIMRRMMPRFSRVAFGGR